MNTQPLPPRLILFDGICAVCDTGMRWIMDHDPDGRFHYAPLQGPTAAAVFRRHPELPDDLDSIVYVDTTGAAEQVTWHTDALLTIARDLGSPWSWLALGRIVPRVLRDAAYRAFATIRYSIFGTLDHCRIPSEDEAARFLP